MFTPANPSFFGVFLFKIRVLGGTLFMDMFSVMQIPVNELLSMDQSDPWKVVPRSVFITCYCILILSPVVVLRRVGCLWITSVVLVCMQGKGAKDLLFNILLCKSVKLLT